LFDTGLIAGRLGRESKRSSYTSNQSFDVRCRRYPPNYPARAE